MNTCIRLAGDKELGCWGRANGRGGPMIRSY